MRRIFVLLLFSVLLTTVTHAQKGYLDGYWKGYITQRTVEGVITKMPFELYLKVQEKNRIVGRSYAYYDSGEVVEMEINGRIFSDYSVSLYDTNFLPLENSEVTPSHSKKYQFEYYRSVFQSKNSLDGYWQEFIDTPMDTKRRLGKVLLFKVSNVTQKA